MANKSEKSKKQLPRITYVATSFDEDGKVAQVQRGEMKVRPGPGWAKFISGQKPAHKRRKAG